jgi:predicted nucleotidyltransferase
MEIEPRFWRRDGGYPGSEAINGSKRLDHDASRSRSRSSSCRYSSAVFVRLGRPTGGQARQIDLFFDTHNPRFSLIELVDVQERVSDILGTETDVMTRASLHPMLRQRIEAEAVRVF